VAVVNERGRQTGPATIGIRHLRENLSRALRRVQAGETLEVTHRGRPVARIVPVVDPSDPLADLVADGTLIPPRDPGPLPQPLDVPSLMSTEEALSIIRGA
jgi:prevent-host-death family protein